MSARALMTVLVRVGGLALLVFGLRDATVLLFWAATERVQGLSWPLALNTLIELVAGLLFALWAEKVVGRFSWPAPREGGDSPAAEDSALGDAIAWRAAGLIALIAAVPPATRSADVTARILETALFVGFAALAFVMSRRRRAAA